MLKKLVLVMLVAVLAIPVMGVVGFGTDELINYHWWTAGGEKEAIDAVFNL
jgi:hypothetical protein